MTKTQYPIVLVHGMMVKDFRFWRSFRGIADFLKAQGVAVYVTDQDGVGAVATNALQLKEEILSVLQKENCEKVNLIAHSKGGVDCRYMITHLDMAKSIAFFTDRFYRICGDRQPDILQLGKDLTPEAMEQFNRDTPNMLSVYYQSYSSSITGKNPLVFIPYNISRHCEQDSTDGMVSVSSSQWGNYQGNLGDDLDHYKMVGVYGTKKQLADVGEFYLHIIAQLQAMGF